MIDVRKTSLWSLLGFIALLSIPVGIAFSALPEAGEWEGHAGFGEISFLVNKEGTGIEEITLSFSDYTCGSVTQSGAITITYSPAVSISDSHFEVIIDLDPDPFIEQNITIKGDFNDTGNSASGSYEAVFNGSNCVGIWQAFSEPIQEWRGRAGFGEIGLMVNSEVTEIYGFTLDFSEYKCGDVTKSGLYLVTLGNVLSISNGEFSKDIYFTEDPTSGIDIDGNFNDLGDSAFGFYEVDFGGTLCKGTWQVFPEGTNTATVTGTLTYPSDAAGKTYAVMMDYDGDGDTEDWVAVESGVCGSGTSVDFTLDAPEGKYYAYAVVWVVGTDYEDPETGDYLGYYGGTSDDRPSSPNLVITSSGTVYCDIDLSVYEEEEPIPSPSGGSSGGGCFISSIFFKHDERTLSSRVACMVGPRAVRSP